MNEYYVNVSFETGKIKSDLKRLVQNDYNSTKINFTFDKEGRVLFKMLYPDKTEYVTDIQNNELIFGAGILNQEGDYEYEISLYTKDGRLTDYATQSFEVRKELVNTDELIEPDDRIPLLDSLINQVDAIKQDVEAGKYNGKDGQTGITPTIGNNGNWYIGDIDTGQPSRGEKGENGGILINEVLEITGATDDLLTENKNNLTSAINEIVAKTDNIEETIENMGQTSGDGSGYLPLCKINTNTTTNIRTTGVTLTPTNYSEQCNAMSEFLTNCYADKHDLIAVLLSNSTGYTVLFDIMRNGLQKKDSVIYSQGMYLENRDIDAKNPLTVITLALRVTWTDDIATVTSIETIVANNYMLTTKNTKEFNPTGNYHPATKKYVDDAIAALRNELTGG